MTGLLPNTVYLHTLASGLSGCTDDCTESVEIDGPKPGAYISYRVTPENKRFILEQANATNRT